MLPPENLTEEQRTADSFATVVGFDPLVPWVIRKAILMAAAAILAGPDAKKEFEQMLQDWGIAARAHILAELRSGKV